ncbi:hypothetical protein PRIPAC_72412 [Pristionchus pacificus]|uniref:FABP domain-containing protein n=1 Tax=Pristionchus pacificus TaxID=54126 RepID=A0A2A6BZ81_PRIPA|nr:hypothetical protein PRIPAC_72412 [Pristionchus pacificus]|eukprot:PDM71312.1 hypothetical protein PRIPAC_37719 [Pristionchus pacificus]
MFPVWVEIRMETLRASLIDFSTLLKMCQKRKTLHGYANKYEEKFSLSLASSLFCSLIIFFMSFLAEMSVPDAYFGSWSVDKNENFDEYLEAKNVPWIARKARLFTIPLMMRSFFAILLAGHNITFTNLGNGRYRAEHKAREIRALI